MDKHEWRRRSTNILIGLTRVQLPLNASPRHLATIGCRCATASVKSHQPTPAYQALCLGFHLYSTDEHRYQLPFMM